MWKLFDSLTPAQIAQVERMFSGDAAINSVLIISASDYRRWFGYFVQPLPDDMDGGNVICRRRKEEIHNWQASSQFD